MGYHSYVLDSKQRLEDDPYIHNVGRAPVSSSLLRYSFLRSLHNSHRGHEKRECPCRLLVEPLCAVQHSEVSDFSHLRIHSSSGGHIHS